MKAKLLKSLRLNGKTVSPNGERPVVVDLPSEKEFRRLEAMSVVAEPTKDDLLLAGAKDGDDETTDEPKSAAKKGAAATGGKTVTQTATTAGANPAGDL